MGEGWEEFMCISVIVPIYNVEKELDRCIQSIINQTYRNLEIILVDDGSPDRCPEICDSYAAQDHRVVVIHKENGGLSSARNAGLKRATGEYVLFVDADDYIELDSCERLQDRMSADIDFAVAGYKEVIGDQTVYRGLLGENNDGVYSAKEFVNLAIRKKSWHPAVWNRLYRRNFLLEHSLYFKEGIIFEDLQIFLKTFLAAKQIAYVHYPFYNYIIRKGSIMQTNGLEKKANLIVEIYDEWMKQIDVLDDPAYKRMLYGNLIRFYMGSCRTFGIRTWRVKGTSFSFAMKYALDTMDRVKVLVFTFMKNIFLKL